MDPSAPGISGSPEPDPGAVPAPPVSPPVSSFASITRNRYPSRSASAAVISVRPPPGPPVSIFAGSSTTSPHAALKWCAANSACRDGLRRSSTSESKTAPVSDPAPRLFGLNFAAAVRARRRAGEPKPNAASPASRSLSAPLASPSSRPSPAKPAAVSRTPPLSRSCDCARGRAKVCTKRKSIRSCTKTRSPISASASVGSVARSVAITTLAASRDRSRHCATSSAATAGRPPTGTAAARKRRCSGTSAAGASTVGASADAGNAPNSKGSRRSSTNTPSPGGSTSGSVVAELMPWEKTRDSVSAAPLAKRSASVAEKSNSERGWGDGRERDAEREKSA